MGGVTAVHVKLSTDSQSIPTDKIFSSWISTSKHPLLYFYIFSRALKLYAFLLKRLNFEDHSSFFPMCETEKPHLMPTQGWLGQLVGGCG